uniref:Uncharacterized protein n=1 Tax=Rhizophora mucronata TaxID=61149 RepID=A0A2P2QL12_RHIMU
MIAAQLINPSLPNLKSLNYHRSTKSNTFLDHHQQAFSRRVCSLFLLFL